MPHDGKDFTEPPPDPALRVKALESLLVEKGLVDSESLDLLIDTYEHKIGPHNGARVVARAWIDEDFKVSIQKDCSAVIKEVFGFEGRQGEHIVAVENTPNIHNVVVCTLCSCFPRSLMGVPPDWYKSESYRSRVVREPRKVLAEFGTEVSLDIDVRVHDNTADMRYLVLPKRPVGTEAWSEENLMALVTRDSMIGVRIIDNPVS